MRSTRIGLVTVVLAASLWGTGCILIPEIKDRIVQLAVSGATSASFDASGPETDPLNKTQVVSIGDGTDLDLRKILDDAGVNVDDVVDVKLQSVAYAITAADPLASRTVQGNLTVQRTAGTEQPLITGFNTGVGAVTPYQPATLQSAGVTEINLALASVLSQLKSGGTATESATFRVTGTTTPNTNPSQNIAFTYAVRLTINMVGSVKVSVPD